MDNNMQTNPTSSLPQYDPPMLNPVKTSKMMLMWLVIGAAVVAVALWWWMKSSDQQSDALLTPAPTAQVDEDLSELNDINANQDINAEFQQIDQDLNNL